MKEKSIERELSGDSLFQKLNHRKICLALRIAIPAVMFAMILYSVLLYANCSDNMNGIRAGFNFGMNLCGMVMLFFLAIAVFIEAVPDDVSSLLFPALFSAVFLGSFTNALCIIAAGNVRLLLLNRVATFLCCLCSPLTTFLYCCYQETFFETERIYRKLHLYVLGILAVADILFFVFNLKFGYVYSIDANGIYVPGKLYALYILYPMIAMLSAMFVSRHILAFSTKKGIVTVIFFLLFLFSGIMIAMDEEIDCTYVFFAWGILLLYGTIQANRGKEIAEKNEILAKQSVDLVKQEQQIMISQINPHFLYNTLSTIECLCETDPILAGETVHSFSDYLRGNVDTLQKMETIPFMQEIEHLGHYVEIEKLRFPKIRVEYDLADRDFCLPSLTVQPMVENAIRYGVRAVENGVITVRSYFDNLTHYIEIEDNGCGFDVNAPKKDDGRTHIGIPNVRSRLEKMVNGDLVIFSKPGVGTKVVISIPAKKEDNG